MNRLLNATGSIGLTDEAVSTVADKLLNWCLDAGIRIIVALFVLFISFRLINFLSRKIEKRCQAKKLDKTIVKTLTYIGKIGAKIVIVICLVGYLGIDTSGLTALVTSLGVCAGLAVNGALSNLAGGVLIILSRPFKIDDYIEAQDVGGTVEDIRIICTKIRTPDNKVIYVPNGALANGNIINYSEKQTRRVDMTFSISYEDDFALAKALVRDICLSHELVLSDPEPFVRVSEHSESSIDIATRVWVKNDDYWTVKFDILEAVKNAFDENGISIPYNQLDVHLKQN